MPNPELAKPTSTRTMRKPKPNYRNVNIHEGLDRAKSYSNLVSNHFSISQYENHVLKSACREYERDIIKRNRTLNTNSSTLKFSKVDNQSIRYKKQGSSRKPKPQKAHDKKSHFQELKGLLQEKTEKVTEYSELFQKKQGAKRELQRKIRELKLAIMNESKAKAKVSLECDRLKNEMEAVSILKNKKQIELFQLKIDTELTEKECVEIANEYEELVPQIEAKQLKIRVQKEQIKELQSAIRKGRSEKKGEEKLTSRMKEMQTCSYRSMSSNFMQVNQLKQEKALLLNEVQNSYKHNT